MSIIWIASSEAGLMFINVIDRKDLPHGPLGADQIPQFIVPSHVAVSWFSIITPVSRATAADEDIASLCLERPRPAVHTHEGSIAHGLGEPRRPAATPPWRGVAGSGGPAALHVL